MSAAGKVPVLVGVLLVAVIAVAGSLWPIDVRHSAPYGFSKTIDFSRLIAVHGGYVTANYEDFDRIDLDLRAYWASDRYDLIVHIRPIAPGAAEIRTVNLSLPASEIPPDKGTLSDPFLTIRFPAIKQSAGQTYYVWIEPGIRNRDDVIALWSIKSYSRVPAWRVVAAFVQDAPGGQLAAVMRMALILLLSALVFSLGWCLVRIATVSQMALRDLNGDLIQWHRHETDGIQ